MLEKYSTIKGVIILSIIELFERFSYYGIRSIIILYAIDSVGLNLDTDNALWGYGIFTILVSVVPLPMGILTDLFFKQTRAVLIGGSLSLIGYLTLLLTNDIYIYAASLIVVVIGTSLVRPNLAILLGRLFDKTDKNRDLGFVVYYFMINFGAFLSGIIVVNFNTILGWSFSFGIIAISTLIYLIIFYVIKDRLDFKEQNAFNSTGVNEEDFGSTDFNDIALDSYMLRDTAIPSAPKNRFNSTLLILLGTLTLTLFWIIQGVSTADFHAFFISRGGLSLNFMGIDVNGLLGLNFFSSISILLLTLIFLVIWYLRGIGSTIFKIGISMLLIGAATIMIKYIGLVPENDLVLYSIIPIILFSLAEVFISPIMMSYVTRLSDVRYSSTIYGVFIFIISGVSGGVVYLQQIFGNNEFSIIGAGLAIFIGFIIFVSKKNILKLSGGLD